MVLNTGDKVLIKGENDSYGRTMLNYNRFITTGQFEIKGNIMSLVSGDSFENADTLTGNYTFNSLFSGATGLTSAENLVLPATTLVSYSYYQMFRECTNLTTAPTLAGNTIGGYSYAYMFYNCTSLTTAPELHATTLASNCYNQMFYGCSSLTTAPELPATTLAQACYNAMFRGCSSLNYIKCLATDISASSCTSGWVRNISSTGTFVKAASMTGWTRGNNGIPTNWTVEDEIGFDDWDDQE